MEGGEGEQRKQGCDDLETEEKDRKESNRMQDDEDRYNRKDQDDQKCWRSLLTLVDVNENDLRASNP